MAAVARPGRPPLDDDDPSVSVHVKVPGQTFDQLYEKSRRERVSMPALVRRAIARELDDDERNEK